ncbi:hypothetical protein JXB28_03030 [Candidatus Woesearchaeota archaeon]|nr:hypothetical protein [Candidatus Woesearchaeota archaeon]
MERNLVKHGDSTLMVSVPAAWVKRHKLKKGDAISISDQGETLLLSRQGWKKTELTGEITFTENNYDVIRAILCKHYRQGYDMLVVNYHDDNIFPTIHKITASIFGYEITDNKKGSCTIKNIVKEFDFDTKTAFKKIIADIDHAFTLVKETLAGKREVNMDEITLLRDEGWKFKDVAFQMLKKDTLGDSFKENYIIHISEQNTTYLRWLLRAYQSQSKKTVSKEFTGLLEKTHTFFIESLIYQKKNDVDYVKYVLSERRKLQEACEAIAQKGGLEAKLVIYIAMIVQNIHNPKSVIVA